MDQTEPRIDVHNSSKRQKNDTCDLVDRISALPDSILGVILSSLPTKNVVSTAFLSKRWKFVWLAVPSLDFYHEGCSKELAEGDDTKFVQFVTRVLHLHDVGSLNKFRLVWNPRHISSSHVSSWIITVIARNVNELSLCVETPNGPFDIPELFEMPIHVFCCSTLKSLELDCGIYVSAANTVHLPRLETLKLVSVVFRSEEAFEKLISGCPVLNYLHLHTDIAGISKYFTEDDDFMYRISSTSLTRLELCFMHDRYNDEPFFCSLKLETSSLEYLKLGGFISEIFVKKNLSSLVEADFRIDLLSDDFYLDNICNSIVEAVRTFDCAKALTLSDDVVRALCCGTISLSSEFKRLVNLEASIECCHWSSLQDLIQSSHSLEVLTIHQIPNHFCGENDPNWIDPIEVPRCLSNSLKKVVIDGYRDEREMIHYLLKHGSALEAMKITCDRFVFDEEFQLLQEICKFPRKSPACEIGILRVERLVQ